MSESPDTSRGADEAQDEQHVCEFPHEYLGEDPDGQPRFRFHGVELSREGGGRPGKYCGKVVTDDDGMRRKHDRMTAFARRRELMGSSTVRRARVPEGRPVTASTTTFESLLAQFQMTAEQHRDQLGDIIAKAAEVVATAGDPDQAVFEVRHRAEAAEVLTDRANAERDDAIRAAQIAQRERDRALEDQELAEGAAEDALSERDAKVAEVEALVDAARGEVAEIQQDNERVRAKTADQLAAMRAETEQARQDAAQRIEQARAETAAQIEAVRADAERRVSAAADAHAADLERVRAETASEVDRARVETAQACTAQQVAEHDRDAAVAAARDEAARVRADAEQQVAAARDEAARVRAGADEEIRALRAELLESARSARTEREQLVTDHAAESARLRKDAAAVKAALDALTRERGTGGGKK